MAQVRPSLKERFAETSRVEAIALRRPGGWPYALVGGSIGAGVIVCEMGWGQAVRGLIAYPVYWIAAAGIGVAGLAVLPRLFVYERDIALLASLSAWFAASMGAERIWARVSGGHAPFDRQALVMLFGYMLMLASAWVGLALGIDRHRMRAFLHRAAVGLAVMSVAAFCLGSPPGGERPPFPAPYVGFPFRLLALFAFSWYLEIVLGATRVRAGSVAGLAATSLTVLVTFHKPVVFSALCSVAVILLLHVFRGIGLRSLGRAALIVGLAGAGFAGINIVGDGAASRYYKEVFYMRYLHSTAIEVSAMDAIEIVESLTGGRISLWAQAWERFGASPVFGTGLAQRELVQPSAYEETLVNADAIPLHNGYLDLLLSLGLFGVTPVAIAALWFLGRVVPRVRGTDGGLTTAVLAFAAGIAGYNLGGTSNLFIFLSAFVLLCMGSMVAPLSRPAREQTTARRAERASCSVA